MPRRKTATIRNQCTKRLWIQYPSDCPPNFRRVSINSPTRWLSLDLLFCVSQFASGLMPPNTSVPIRCCGKNRQATLASQARQLKRSSRPKAKPVARTGLELIEAADLSFQPSTSPARVKPTSHAGNGVGVFFCQLRIHDGRAILAHDPAIGFHALPSGRIRTSASRTGGACAANSRAGSCACTRSSSHAGSCSHAGSTCSTSAHTSCSCSGAARRRCGRSQ